MAFWSAFTTPCSYLITLSPMSILVKQKVLRWGLAPFTAGSMVSLNSFSTNWQINGHICFTVWGREKRKIMWEKELDRYKTSKSHSPKSFSPQPEQSLSTDACSCWTSLMFYSRPGEKQLPGISLQTLVFVALYQFSSNDKQCRDRCTLNCHCVCHTQDCLYLLLQLRSCYQDSCVSVTTCAAICTICAQSEIPLTGNKTYCFTLHHITSHCIILYPHSHCR